MNECSPRPYQRSQSVPMGTASGTAECEHLERFSSEVGCCQRGFIGFMTASSTLSTNCRHGGIWLLPLVVGSLLIISPQTASWCLNFLDQTVPPEVLFLGILAMFLEEPLRLGQISVHVCNELQGLMLPVLAQSQRKLLSSG